MVTYNDGKKVLVTPISAEDLKDVHIGDILYSCVVNFSPAVLIILNQSSFSWSLPSQI